MVICYNYDVHFYFYACEQVNFSWQLEDNKCVMSERKMKQKMERRQEDLSVG